VRNVSGALFKGPSEGPPCPIGQRSHSSVHRSASLKFFLGRLAASTPLMTFRCSYLRTLTAAALLGPVALAGCLAETSAPEEWPVYRVEACGEPFHVRILDPRVAEEAERLSRSGDQRIITGILRRGGGGFNPPWSWHLDPLTVGFADVTIGLCDGCPSMVERELDYWVDTVEQFCPWSTRVTGRVR